jgi:hypothetical protein
MTMWRMAGPRPSPGHASPTMTTFMWMRPINPRMGDAFWRLAQLRLDQRILHFQFHQGRSNVVQRGTERSKAS